jgi:hypothetical protein
LAFSPCLLAVFFFSCEKEKNEQVVQTQPPSNDEPLPPVHHSVRDSFLVDSVAWYESAENYKLCKYEYDELNRLKRRVLKTGIIEYSGMRIELYIDTFLYSNGRLEKIEKSVTNGGNTSSLGYFLFFYDNEGKIVKSKYVNNETCYGYHNGRVDSIYWENTSDFYSLLDYDANGNVIRERRRCLENTTGQYYFQTTNYNYDNRPRPNFGMGDNFVYEPLMGMGTVVGNYIRNGSTNNLLGNGYSYWSYEYNEHGLPKAMYTGRFPGNSTKWQFFYKAVE